ncbi:hypothetical protein Tco_0309019 [Tanacetum coccineum]
MGTCDLLALSTKIFATFQRFSLGKFRGTDISKITRKPPKTDKHGHEKRKSTREAKDSKPKPKKVNSQSTMGQQIMSDLEDSTVTYTAVSSPFEDGSDIGSPRVDGPPIMPEDPYAYIMAAYQEDEIIPTEEQPLPAAASPTADSPGYVPKSDLEEEPEEDNEDPEEDPADYPADRDDDDEEEFLP